MYVREPNKEKYTVETEATDLLLCQCEHKTLQLKWALAPIWLDWLGEECPMMPSFQDSREAARTIFGTQGENEVRFLKMENRLIDFFYYL